MKKISIIQREILCSQDTDSLKTTKYKFEGITSIWIHLNRREAKNYRLDETLYPVKPINSEKNSC